MMSFRDTSPSLHGMAYAKKDERAWPGMDLDTCDACYSVRYDDKVVLFEGQSDAMAYMSKIAHDAHDMIAHMASKDDEQRKARQAASMAADPVDSIETVAQQRGISTAALMLDS